MPEIPRLERAALEVQHAVVLGNHVQVATSSRHARKLGEHAVGVRNRLNDVAAHGEVEAAVLGVEVVDALVLESEPWRKVRITRSRKVQVRIDDVHAEDARPPEKLGQARCGFARAATGIEDPRLGWERVAGEQRDFLRPDGARLCRKVAHHRLVGHLLGLRIEIRHGFVAGNRTIVSL